MMKFCTKVISLSLSFNNHTLLKHPGRWWQTSATLSFHIMHLTFLDYHGYVIKSSYRYKQKNILHKWLKFRIQPTIKFLKYNTFNPSRMFFAVLTFFHWDLKATHSGLPHFPYLIGDINSVFDSNGYPHCYQTAQLSPHHNGLLICFTSFHSNFVLNTSCLGSAVIAWKI